jgi:pilus assembly protein Flp/PilA
MKTLAKFAKCEAGATAIEYGLIAALISVASIAAISGVSTEIQATFNEAQGAMAGR